MAQFVLTAQLQLQAPKNASKVLDQLQNQLKGVQIPVTVKAAAQATKQINQVTAATNKAASAAEAMGISFGLAIKRFAAFTVASRAVSLFTNTLANAVDEAIDFQREVVKIAQVTGKTVKELKGLEQTITRLSVTLGTSSKELLSTARILSQAGVKAGDLKVAIEALAKTTLAPTFEDINKTAEGAVAILAQFEGGVGRLEKQLGAVNAVAGTFAVESGDLISAVRRFGGVFNSAGGNLEELLALFTSVRATTRESSESIATGLRTIFTRIQRPKTIEFLRQFGVELLDVNGKFIGPLRAVEQLNKAFAGLEQGDITFVRVAEELGGFRQIGKVIPLIQQYGVAVDALNVAQEGQNSLSADAEKAQQALAVQITKVKEEFLALVRGIAGGTSFQLFARTALEVASALIKVADAIKPLIPLIGSLAAFKFARGLGGFAASAGSALKGLGKNQGGVIQKFARGGFVPGTGNRDTVPAMLTPGEFVIKKSSAKKLGAGTLQAMNENRFALGGTVGAIALNPIGGEAKANGKVTLQDIRTTLFSNNQLRGDTSGNSKIFNKNTEGYQTAIKPKFAEVGKAPFRERFNKLIKRIAFNGKSSQNFTVKGVAFPSTADSELSTEDKIKDNLRKSFTDIIPEAAKDLKSTLPKGAGVKIGRFNESIVKAIGLEDAAGKIFEGAVSSFGVPFNTGGGDQDDFDFPLGIGSNLARYAPFAELQSVATDAKKTLSKKELDGIANRKTKNFLASQVNSSPAFQQLRQAALTLPKSSTKESGERRQRVQTRNSGGSIGGSGDTVPALLTPGEFVINKKAAESIGYGNLNSMNKTGVARFNKGGAVQMLNKGGTAGGGGGINLDKVFFLTSALGAASAAVDSFGDASADASDIQAKLTIGLKNTLSAATVFSGIFLVAIKPINDFGSKLKDSTKDLGDLGKAADKASQQQKKAAGKDGLTRDQGLTRRQRFARAIPGTKSNIEALTKQLENENKIQANAQKRVDIQSAARQTAAKELEVASKSGNEKLLAKARYQNSRAAKKLERAIRENFKATERATKAEKALAKSRRVRGRVGEAISRGAKAGGVVAAIAVLGSQIADGFTQWFKRAEEQAKASDNIAGAIEAAGKASVASSIGELLTLQGVIEAFFDTEGFLEKRAQKKEQAEFQSAFGFIESRRSSSAEEIKGGGDVDDALKGVKEAFARSRAEAQDLTGPAREKAIQAVDSATRAEIGRLDKLGVSVDALRQQAINLTGGNEALRKELLAQVDAIEANRKAQQELNKANLDATKIVSAFGAAANASAQLVAGLETGANSLALLSQELDNASGKLGVDATDAINQSEAALLSSLPANSPLAASIRGQADVARATNKFGLNAAAELGDLELAKGDKGKEQLEQALFDAIPDKADAATKAKLEAVIRKNVAGIEGDVTNADLNALTQQILSDGQELSKGFREAVKLQSQHNATMTKLYADREQLEQKAAAAANQAIETQLEAAKVFESFGGSRLTGEQQLGARIAQFNNIGGLGGLGAQLTTGSAADINAVAAQISQTFADQADQVIGGALAAGAGLQKGGPFQGAGGFAADKRPEAQAANKALIQFTKQRISLLKEELNIVKQKNAAEKSAIDKLISGDVEGFLDQQAAAGAGAALASGSTGLAGLFSASALGAGFKTLQGQGLSDQQLRGAEDLTLQRFGIQGTGVLSGTTAEEEALKAEGRELAGALGGLASQEAAFAKSEISIQDATISATRLSFDRKLGEVQSAQTAKALARGGVVYASRGMFVPRGTDTVPAMLTPGEFVVNRAAVNRGNNLQILRAMNTGGGASAPGALSGGGSVRYYNDGGFVDGIANVFTNALPGLTNIFSGFAETVEKLVNTKFNVALDPTNINVNFNGASFLETLKDDIKDGLLTEVGNEIQKYKANNSGDLVKKDSVL